MQLEQGKVYVDGFGFKWKCVAAQTGLEGAPAVCVRIAPLPTQRGRPLAAVAPFMTDGSSSIYAESSKHHLIREVPEPVTREIWSHVVFVNGRLEAYRQFDTEEAAREALTESIVGIAKITLTNSIQLEQFEGRINSLLGENDE